MPTVFAVVSELPRGALVEKQVLIHIGRFEFEGDDDDEPTVRRDVAPLYSEGAPSIPNTSQCSS